MDPIVAGMCRMESLRDGTLNLSDFAMMNDSLAAKYENEARVAAAMEQQRDR
jgi:hypothetical protein